ncbi:MAG: T9SS type A sorting domain-containing protein [bacterium]
MTKFVTALFLGLCLFTASGVFAQSSSTVLRPDGAKVQDPTGVFLAPPHYAPSFAPLNGSHNSTQSVEWVSNVDMATGQFAYAYFPTTIGISQQDGSTVVDTVVGYTERFTSPYTASTYLDSVQVGIGIPDGALTSGANQFRLIISAWSAVVPSGNSLPYPSKLIDSTSVSYEDLSQVQTGGLQYLTVKMKHKKVGRSFFITVETPFDFNSDFSGQQVIGIFGDSLDFASPVDTAIQRSVASGFPYQFYWVGITRGGGEPFYQNFFIFALVNSSLSAVDDKPLTGNALAQNFPNPFNPSTEIKYSVANDTRVSLKVYNALGVQVATLVDGFQNTGEHSVNFAADALPTGTYFYTLKSGDFSQTKRMVLSK